MTNSITEWPYNDPALDFAALAETPYALLFDGKTRDNPRSRYSYICWQPEEIIELGNDFNGDPFQFLQERLSAFDAPISDPELPPFQGGAAGCFGYDLGRYIETLPAIAKHDTSMPNMMIGIYKNVIAYDHEKQKAWCFGKKPQRQKSKTTPQSFDLQWKPDCSDERYIEKIEKIIDHIFSGEIYQACLTRRFSAKTPPHFNAYHHYMQLRDINPAPFSAFMNFGDVKLSSCSPEQFLHCKNGCVETRPIKGTIPSSSSPAILLNSDKDRAENLMIVDLLRNDLGKVCDFHSIKVPELYKVETYEGLHHLVSSVTGTLKKECTALDLLKACFPGGSITGAPKIRAMEILEELEPNRRGPHMGALGMIGFDGYMNTSITIRTLVYKGDKVQIQTGGGIVADSRPENELQETLDKAQKLFESFEDTKDSTFYKAS